MKPYPLPPLNTLGYILADPATALPLLEGERVVVFSTEAAAKRYRQVIAYAKHRRADDVAKLLAVAMVPLMVAGTAAQGAIVTDLEASQVVGLDEVAEGRKRQRRRLGP